MSSVAQGPQRAVDEEGVVAEAERLLATIRFLLEPYIPGISQILSTLTIMPDMGVETASVNANGVIRVNPVWFSMLDKRAKLAVLFHEVLHYLNLHPYLSYKYADVLHPYVLNMFEDAALYVYGRALNIGRISYLTPEDAAKFFARAAMAPDDVKQKIENLLQKGKLVEAIEVAARWCRSICSKIASNPTLLHNQNYRVAAIVCRCLKCPKKAGSGSQREQGKEAEREAEGRGTAKREDEERFRSILRELYRRSGGSVAPGPDVEPSRPIEDIKRAVRRFRSILESARPIARYHRPVVTEKSAGTEVPSFYELLDKLLEDIESRLERRDELPQFFAREVTPYRSFYKPGKTTIALAAAGFNPAPVTPSTTLAEQPHVIVSLVDVSGSINLSELKSMCSILMDAIEQAQPDKLLVVFFSVGPVDVYESDYPTKDEFLHKLTQVGIRNVGGGTYLAPALDYATGKLMEIIDTLPNPRVIITVLSDFVFAEEDVEESIKRLKAIPLLVKRLWPDARVELILYTTDAGYRKVAERIAKEAGEYYDETVLYEISRLAL